MKWELSSVSRSYYGYRVDNGVRWYNPSVDLWSVDTGGGWKVMNDDIPLNKIHGLIIVLSKLQ